MTKLVPKIPPDLIEGLALAISPGKIINADVRGKLVVRKELGVAEAWKKKDWTGPIS